MSELFPASFLAIVAAVLVAMLLSIVQMRRGGLQGHEIFTGGWRGRAHPGMHIAKHGIGACFAAVFLLVANVLTRSAKCASTRDAHGNTVFDFQREGCTTDLYGSYLVLTDWQQGIGAVLGLLGVGYAALLAALMAEDRKELGKQADRKGI